MKVLLIFAAILLTSVHDTGAASRRDLAANSTNVRAGAVGQRVTTTERGTAAPRATTLAPRSVAGGAVKGASRADAAVVERGNGVKASVSRAAAGASSARSGATQTASRSAVANARSAASVAARVAAIDESSDTISQTRVGAEYEQCKSAFFTCMDQFCTLKNDDYHRCSCSNRVFKLAEARQDLTEAGQQLTVFTENLNVVGMTAAQASAMKTASEGEYALTADSSASKALLQAIMNSIRGKDASVGGKYSELNSINISFDTVNAFGMTDTGQAIAKNNGQNLYTAVYPQCRAAVKADCNDASLQRAINAYLMAIEQDCNTVQAAIEAKQKEMKSAIREGGAMLDLARVENRQKHNSSDVATCIAEVEAAILSEEVCGAGYHRCLDNGEYIDLTTGAPIAGVVDFYKLGQLLTFASGVDAASQTLAHVSSNGGFVASFENRVKKFAQPALDKCTEKKDEVWAEYLDKAMLDIYYAQQAKVDEIKQGCFDFVSACYMNGDTAITAAMKALTSGSDVVIQPSKIALNSQMCSDYVNSCNNMFDKDIIAEYINNRQNIDTLTACRAVVQQCFDKYGGKNYENFYYPYSGLFSRGDAPDWFTLYEIKPSSSENPDSVDTNDKEYPLRVSIEGTTFHAKYKSDCAKQLTSILACSDQQMIENAFGGLDLIFTTKNTSNNSSDVLELSVAADNQSNASWRYATLTTKGESVIAMHRYLRPTGVATEVYNQVVDMLSTQCLNLDGRFVEYQWIDTAVYGTGTGADSSFCIANFGSNQNSGDEAYITSFAIGKGENMCPRDYNMDVDTRSWGACLCWQNGGRRSKWGKSAKCIAGFPVATAMNDASCGSGDTAVTPAIEVNQPVENWCITTDRTEWNQVCIKNSANLSCDKLPPAVPKGVSY